MRTMLFLAVAVAAVICAPRAGQAYEGRWCAVTAIGWGAVSEECSFRTLEACLPFVIAGNRGQCVENPRWAGTDNASKRTRKYRKRRARKQ